jgi:UDP-glucose 4-epimerase
MLQRTGTACASFGFLGGSFIGRLRADMTILVTGSTGHLGEALVRCLRSQARPVRGVDLNPSPFTDAVGSITDRDFVGDVMRGIEAVIHVATLHKPHLATHTAQAFIDTNITGTSMLLEAASAAGVSAFVFTSTTSVFGLSMTPAGEPAAWVTEELRCRAANIYGVTKLAAENLCELVARRQKLPLIVLRTARFFPEADDDAGIRSRYESANAQANELLFRRADIEDVAAAHLLAIGRAGVIGFGRYIVSATTPFTPKDLVMLRHDAPAVVLRRFPECAQLYAERGWRLFPTIDRVYVNALAMRALGWEPQYDFRHVLESLRAGRDFRSPLAREVGSKGYHARMFADGPYPVLP